MLGIQEAHSRQARIGSEQVPQYLCLIHTELLDWGIREHPPGPIRDLSRQLVPERAPQDLFRHEATFLHEPPLWIRYESVGDR